MSIQHLKMTKRQQRYQVSGNRPPACPGVSCASGGVTRPEPQTEWRPRWPAGALEPGAVRAGEGGVSRGRRGPGRRHVSQLGLPVFKPSQDGEGTQGRLSF